MWDYNYDAVTGIRYSIDISQPVGKRILGLSWQGRPIDGDQDFVLAINSYRMSGGGTTRTSPKLRLSGTRASRSANCSSTLPRR